MRDWGTWFKQAGIRAIKTMAQTAIATIGAAAVLSDVDWAVVASASLLSGILSLLTSIAGLPEEQSVEVSFFNGDPQDLIDIVEGEEEK